MKPGEIKRGEQVRVLDTCPSVNIRGAYGTVQPDLPGVPGCVIVLLDDRPSPPIQIHPEYLERI